MPNSDPLSAVEIEIHEIRLHFLIDGSHKDRLTSICLCDAMGEKNLFITLASFWLRLSMLYMYLMLRMSPELEEQGGDKNTQPKHDSHFMDCNCLKLIFLSLPMFMCCSTTDMLRSFFLPLDNHPAGRALYLGVS